jgi:hypothetical protein
MHIDTLNNNCNMKDDMCLLSLPMGHLGATNTTSIKIQE